MLDHTGSQVYGDNTPILDLNHPDGRTGEKGSSTRPRCFTFASTSPFGSIMLPTSLMAAVTNHRAPAIFLGLALLITAHRASADEGMWLYNNPPRTLLHEKYDFELTDAWLEHLQLA